MTIGDVNTTLYTGNITYTSSDYSVYWEIPLDDMARGATSLKLSASSVLIDTGTSLIYMPQKAAAALYAGIPGSSEVGGGIYQYLCK